MTKFSFQWIDIIKLYGTFSPLREVQNSGYADCFCCVQFLFVQSKLVDS